MRLTRAAARKANSHKIPNEILTEMFSHMARPDLARICRTTKKYRAVAIPLLYRRVADMNALELESWVDTMMVNSELSPYVWYFQPHSTGGLSQKAAMQLPTVLAGLPNLRILNVVGDLCQLSEALYNARFKQLHTIECTAMQSNSTCLAMFLNRQEALRTLRMASSSRNPGPFEVKIELPKLTNYRGESMFIPNLHDSTVCRLTTVRLWAWSFDIEWDPLMETFGRFGALRDLTADVWRVKASAALEAIAKRLPSIERIKIIAKGPKKFDVRPEIGLAELPHVLCLFQGLNFLSFESFPPDEFDIHKTVIAWGESCPTLGQICIGAFF
ncbi:hypothetical protein MSAN_02323900 [Mycena sanguinolenta]|uniref:F-box domain-containing protein n=1 Tax=Mycena sanguinolenta TaxID=230812 RepID=A0A8H6X866_9AGAR|nr:hypothetical protein MSAN_02323900 [Mycena sanguinolenta]